MISRSLLVFTLILLGVILAFAVESHAKVAEHGDFSVNVEDPYGGKPPKPSKPSKPSKPTKPTKPTKPSKPSKPMKPVKPTKPTKPTKPHMGSTGVNSGKHNILPGVPTPLPHVNPVKRPVPVEGSWDSGSSDDQSSDNADDSQSSDYSSDDSASTTSVLASDASVMSTVQSQQNTKVSVGSYSGVPSGFFTTQSGALVYQGKMDTDCDGAPSCPKIDPYGQTSTSFTYQGKAIDALKTNYIVLPSDLSRKLGSKIKLGDIVAVGYNGQVSYAVYADNGPLGKAGEGSVHLSQELGFNPYCGSKICRGISSGVQYVVFPGSRSKYTSPYDSATITAAGQTLLRQAVNN